MNSPLLEVKLHLPLMRASWVPRPHLIERLNAALSRKSFTLISTPPGFGKTSLLSAWVQQVQIPVAWLSLDSSDNDPLLFWSSFFTAVERSQPGSGSGALAALSSNPPPAMDNMLAGWLNAVSGSQLSLVIVLDDLHAVTNPAIHASLVFCLDHLPAGLHLVISTRTDPPWPIARKRAINEINELRTQDLRFTAEEASYFLKWSMGLELVESQVATLETRTEGWAAGLQMAALALQGRADTAQFIQAFSGSNRYVGDYLVEEVFDRLSEETRTFLLSTSILEQLCGSLCNAVTGGEDGQQLLEILEQANLFLFSLDDERRWFRYHRLFADLLQNRLQANYSSILPDLHLRASAWYLANEQIQPALQHALAAKRPDQAAGIIEQQGAVLLAAGRWGQLLSWLRALPAESILNRPLLSLYFAWGLALTGQPAAVEPYLAAVENTLANNSTDRLGQFAHWRSQVAAVRSRAAYLEGRLDAAVRLSQQALQTVPSYDYNTRGILAFNLGLSYISSGNLVQATKMLEEARLDYQTAGNSSATIEAAGTLAQIHEMQGNLRLAADIYRTILEQSGERVDANVISAHINLANVLIEWHQLSAALEHLLAGLLLARQIYMPDAALLALLWQARVLLEQGNRGTALALIRTAEAEALQFPSSILNQYFSGLLAYLLVLCGETSAGRIWLQASALPPEDALAENLIAHRYASLAQARLWIAEGLQDRAELYLEKLQIAAQASGLYGARLEALCLKALAQQARQDWVNAAATLAQTIRMAEPAGYTSVFSSLGPEGAPLLHFLQQRSSAPEYLKHLVKELNLTYSGPLPVPPAPHEPLSPRELEVLRLIAAGKSNHEIASELVLATGTVKRHISNIFGKLSVENRTQCVARARELGLLR